MEMRMLSIVVGGNHESIPQEKGLVRRIGIGRWLNIAMHNGLSRRLERRAKRDWKPEGASAASFDDESSWYWT